MGAVRAVTKIVTLFLVVMVIAALFGRWRFGRGGGAARAAFCANCGRPRIGKTACFCGKA